ncbi:hypothetical protein MVEN_02337100 [Mycena venus]|uniref:DUF7330 domain-containing protein n=1 Tax=Mycena venus TaxID=2733690 RepID=A0A8H6X3R7_9AGAR|nr:hypothetical protein MVEN_02337100 [Mycena venus]
MSSEVPPPPTYSFTSPRNSLVPSEDLVSAQGHSSGIPADVEVHAGEQRLPDPVVSSEARIPAFPDHKLQPAAPLLRWLSNSNTSPKDAAQPKLNPTNYVSMFRKTDRRACSLSRFGASIKGTFAVNPFLEIPARLLSPLPQGVTTRKNLVLKVENGGIDVDVHLIGKPTPNALPTTVARTELHLELCGGMDNTFPLFAKIHTPTLRRPPFHVTVVSKNGFTSMHLPPSFHGLLTVRVAAGDLNNHITLSAALGAHATILSEDSTSRAYFIGALGTGRWEGDRAEIRVERGEGAGAV